MALYCVPPTPVNDAKLAIIGAYTASDAYPNVLHKIAILKQLAGNRVIELSRPFNPAPRYHKGGAEFVSLAVRALALSWHNLRLLLDVIRCRHIPVVYCPYPAVVLLLLVSLLPRRLRPESIIADVFISLYDTVVNDRRRLKSGGLPARLLRRVERRAIDCARLAIVDTPENTAFHAELFGLPASKFQAIPIAVNEAIFTPRAYPEAAGGIIRILFVGTLVPLHGITTLCQAIRRLPPQTALTLDIVGDGQMREAVQALVTEALPITVNWHSQWLSSSAIANFIAHSHVCLGLFSANGKSGRVWPIKNYLYMCSGRPIVTARSACSRRLSQQFSQQVLLHFGGDNPASLAGLLGQLPARFDELKQMAKNSRTMYEQHLSHTAIATECARWLQH